MGSEFDEVAKAVAKNMPRRKVLKLFAGGLAAAIGTAVAGSATSAQPFDSFGFGFGVCEPVINNTASAESVPIINSSFPYLLPGFQESPNYIPFNKECIFVNGNEGLWNIFNNNGF
ncbi:MAG: hypothetical protein WBW04_03270 [Nitrolancea sp.]